MAFTWLRKSRRVGPKMELSAAYVASHPDCAMIDVAQFVGPNGSLRYGYAIVHRALDMGLIVMTGRRNGRSVLRVPAQIPCSEHDDCREHEAIGVACMPMRAL